MEADLEILVARAARHMEQDDERCAGPDRNGNEAVESERRHQVAKLGLAEHPTENDQDDKLRREPEHARAGADQQNAEIALILRPQPRREAASRWVDRSGARVLSTHGHCRPATAAAETQHKSSSLTMLLTGLATHPCGRHSLRAFGHAKPVVEQA